MPGIGSAPGGSMAMKDVCDLQPWPAHGRRATARFSAFLRSVARAGRAGWSPCGSSIGDAGVKGRGVELGMAEQNLDDADVGVLFQQMRGEAVAQRVRRHALLDAGGLGSGMDGAIELAGGERLERIATGKQP